MESITWRGLGTSVVLGVESRDTLAAAREAVLAEVTALDLACSRFRDDSDLVRLNAAGGEPVVVSELLGEAIRVALRAASLTGGAVDPTVGAAVCAIGYDSDFASVAREGPGLTMALAPAPGWHTVSIEGDPAIVRLPAGVLLDLGATAKALGADRAAAAAAAASGAGVIVSLGGDIATGGTAPPEGWPVTVTDDSSAPAPGGQRVTLGGGGLATSSTTVRRWQRGGTVLHHIVDPRTGAPASSPFRTVSVAAGNCVDANIASTATLVRGDAGAEWLEATRLPARLVTADGWVIRLNGWPDPAEVAA